jgi:hypothetical protein
LTRRSQIAAGVGGDGWITLVPGRVRVDAELGTLGRSGAGKTLP